MRPIPFGYMGGVGGDTRMITKWELTNPADLDVTLWGPTAGVTTWNYDVDWGDGSAIETGITTNDKSHTYASIGTYEIKIAGQFAGFYMSRGPGADGLKLIEFVQWGSESKPNSLFCSFKSCSNMVYSATDAPDLTNLTSSTTMSQTFRDCHKVTSLDLSGWTNTGNITSFYFAFYNTKECTVFDLTGWDTSNVTDAQQGFRQIGTTIPAKVVMPNLDWTNNSSANTLYQSFVLTEFSEAPILTGWTLPPAHNVNLAYMLYLTKGAFPLDLTGWTNTNKITNMASFISYGESTSIDITGWDTSSCTTYYSAFRTMPNLTHITDLKSLSAASATGNAIHRMFSENNNQDFGAPGSVTNFGVDWGPNLGACTDTSYMFHTAGATAGSPYGQPPDVANWDMTGITTAYQMFVSAKWSAGLDFSSWDMSGLTTANGIAYFLYSSKGTVDIDFGNLDLPNTQTDLKYMFAYSDVKTVTWGSGCDFSNVTTIQYQCYKSPIGATAITSYSFPTNADFTSLVDGHQFMNSTSTMGTLPTNYDNFLTRMDATWVDPGGFSGTLAMGASTYTGGGAVATARANLIAAGWTINDGGIYVP